VLVRRFMQGNSSKTQLYHRTSKILMTDRLKILYWIVLKS